MHRNVKPIFKLRSMYSARRVEHNGNSQILIYTLRFFSYWVSYYYSLLFIHELVLAEAEERDRGATLKVGGLTSDSEWGGGGTENTFSQ